VLSITSAFRSNRPAQHGIRKTGKPAIATSPLPGAGAAGGECRGVAGSTASRVRFGVHVRNDNRERNPPLVQLKPVCGPGDGGEPVITVMLNDEDRQAGILDQRTSPGEALTSSGLFFALAWLSTGRQVLLPREVRTGYLHRDTKGKISGAGEQVTSTNGSKVMRRCTLAGCLAGVLLAFLQVPACSGQEPWTILQAKGGAVHGVAFSPDGKTLAAGCEDGTVELWEVLTGTRRATLKGHNKQVTSVAFNSDGKLLASGSEDGTVRLWNLKTGRLQATLRGHTTMVMSLAFSGNAKLLASGGWDDTVRLWDLTTGKERATLRGHTGEVRSVALSGDGKLLAFGGNGGTIRLGDADTGQVKAGWIGHTGAVLYVAFSGDSKLLASSGLDGTIRLWDVQALLKAKK
jgi:WD40 repeat protein